MLVVAWLCTAHAGVGAEQVQDAVASTAEARAVRGGQPAPAHEPEIYARAASGEVVTGVLPVEGEAAKMGWGVAVFDTPIDALWNAVNDDPGRVPLTPLSHAEVIRGGHCGTDRLVFQYLPLSIVSDRYWVARIRQNAEVEAKSDRRVREAWWSSVDPSVASGDAIDALKEGGIPSGATKGAWLFTAVDTSHTLVEYWTLSDPGGRVPAGIASSFAAGSIGDTLNGVVKLAKKGPGCSL